MAPPHLRDDISGGDNVSVDQIVLHVEGVCRVDAPQHFPREHQVWLSRLVLAVTSFSGGGRLLRLRVAGRGHHHDEEHNEKKKKFWNVYYASVRLFFFVFFSFFFLVFFFLGP